MVASYTTKLNLGKHAAGDTGWHTVLNANFDTLEARLTTSYAGDPNGNVAGYWVGQNCVDTTNKVTYYCFTATGVAGTSVWKTGAQWFGIGTDINGMTAETAPAIGDFLPAYDLSATANRKFTFENFFKVINGFTEDTTPDAAADFVLTYDASASGVKKAKPQNIAPATKIAHIQYQVADGNDSASITAGSFQKISFNTEVNDVDGIVSIASGQFTLQAGSYDMTGFAVICENQRGAKVRIQNVTDGITVATGATSRNAEGGGSLTFAIPINGTSVITGAKVFEMQIWTENTGVVKHDNILAGVEVYADVYIRKHK